MSFNFDQPLPLDPELDSARREWLELRKSFPHEFAVKAAEAREAGRRALAEFVGAQPDKLIFAPDVRTVMSFVPRLLAPLEYGQLLISDLEYPHLIRRWTRLSEEFDARLVELKPEALKDRIGAPDTTLCCSHVSCRSGEILPVRDLCESARRSGNWSLIDGAQATGHIPTDVQDIGADFYVGSLSKWFGLSSGAFLCSRDVLPPRLSWLENQMTSSPLDLLLVKKRLESGFSYPSMDKREWARRLIGLQECRVESPSPGIISFYLPSKLCSSRFSERLEEKGFGLNVVSCRSRELMRLCLLPAITKEDVRELAACIEDMLTNLEGV